MTDKIRAAILGSFVGDSMALGTHWVYDQDLILKEHGRVEGLLRPTMVEYHSKKALGDFTHYGDQAYELLLDVSTHGEFNLDSYASRFRALFKGNYNGYVDKATQRTLDLITVCTDFNECKSNSTDLGGVSRMAPLLLSYANDISSLKESVDSFVAYTHDDVKVKETADFFATLTYKILHDGLSPSDIIKKLKDTDKYPHINQDIIDGLDSVSEDSPLAIKRLGMSCDVSGALASTIHLIVKYENDFNKAIIENVMAGGDSAARGMLVGMVLGSYLGLDSINKRWLSGMKRYEDILGFISQTKHSHYYDDVA
ncbi:MAG: ADP-ribosylation/Crystallin J1 [Sulfurimonas sp.]|nr:MAG: ADP-ribosylation/Crystallin J1 [Sulfurimonas sp.]